MAIKIHGTRLSNCTMRVIVAVFEKNLEFELVTVDLMRGAHKMPEFLALQPFGQVPLLQDGDLSLFESRAIIRYIAEKYDHEGTALYGSTMEEKARVEQWVEVEGQNYNPPALIIISQLVLAPLKGLAIDHELVEANVKKLGQVLDIYEEHLAKNKYLAGDFFSIADLSHLPLTHYIVHAAKKGDLFTSRKNVCAWWERISSRPAWKNAVQFSLA